MNKKIKILVSLCLILIGAILITLPQLSTVLLKRETENAVNHLQQVDAEQLKENITRTVESDFHSIQSINVQDTFAKTLLGTQDIIDAYANDIIGRLMIDDLDIDLTLFNGTNNDKLLVGVTTMKSNQVMGQGNFSIAGHYVGSKGVLLNQLPEIQLGTTIKITNKETVYEYKVYKTELVPATSLYLIEDQIALDHGKPIITLMSCYYYDSPDKRWFAFAELVDSYPYSQLNQKTAN